MNKKNIMFLVIAIIFFIVALALFIYANSFDSKNNSQNSTNTTIVDSHTSKEPYFFDIDKKKFNLHEFSDKPTVILLWKSDNSKSYDIINLFQKYYNNYKDEINFLAINVNESNIDLDLIDNVKAAGFEIPIYFDTDLTLINEFSYEKLPYLVFIESDGTIGKEVTETIDEDAFEANLELLVKNY